MSVSVSSARALDLGRVDAATAQLHHALDVALRSLVAKRPDEALDAIKLAQSALETQRRTMAEFQQEMMCLLFESARDRGTLQPKPHANDPGANAP